MLIVQRLDGGNPDAQVIELDPEEYDMSVGSLEDFPMDN